MPATGDGRAFEPLPVPLPAGDTPASGLDEREPAPGTARLDRQAAPPPVAPPATPAGTPGAAPSPAATTSATESAPRVLDAPAPEYPPAALRAGISGEVVIRIDVGADGRPASLEIVRSSRNRDLDRAA